MVRQSDKVTASLAKPGRHCATMVHSCVHKKTRIQSPEPYALNCAAEPLNMRAC